MDAAAQHQPPHRRLREGIGICFLSWCVMWSFMLPCMFIMGGLYFVMDQNFGQEPHYSVAIDSVSHLDPVFNAGGRPVLDLEFNLTLRVASQGFWDRECAGAGMRAEVSYHGVSLASSAATTEAICAVPMMAVDRHVVARGAGVVVPGSVLDSLAADMHNGAQVFDVDLHGWGKDASWTCGPRRVGDGGALEMDCKLPSSPGDGHA